MDRRPNARAAIGPGDRSRAELKRLTKTCHVLDRHFDAELERLRCPGVDDAYRTRTVGGEPAKESRDLVQRPLRRREPDPLKRTPALRMARRDEPLEPLEREREMRSALGRHHRVDLVDDHGLDVLQCRARRGREHEIQRFRRRDEDVGRRFREAQPVLRRRVAGADRDGRLAQRLAEACCGVADARDRRAQVALDVHDERLERRHIKDAASPGGPLNEVIDAREEGGERLTRTGRRHQQRAVAPSDRRPSLRLRGCGGGEGRPEPLAHGRMELLQRLAPHTERLLARAPGYRRVRHAIEACSRPPRAERRQGFATRSRR